MIKKLINVNDFNSVNDKNHSDHKQMKTILARRINKLNFII